MTMILDRRRVLRLHYPSTNNNSALFLLYPQPYLLLYMTELSIQHSNPNLNPQPQLVVQRAASLNWLLRSASKNSNATASTHTSTGTTTNSDLGSTRSSPSTGVVRSTSTRSRSRVGSGRGGDGNPSRNDNPTFYSTRTPNASRTDLSERGEGSVGRKMSGKGTRNPTLTAMMIPTKLVKRKSFGFVHLGKGVGGHWGGENEVVDHSRGRDAVEEDGEGKRGVIERAEDQKDEAYPGLRLGHVGAKGGGSKVNGGNDDECETSGTPPKIEKRNRRQSLSRLLMDRDKESKGKDADGVLEKGKEDHQKKREKKARISSCAVSDQFNIRWCGWKT